MVLLNSWPRGPLPIGPTSFRYVYFVCNVNNAVYSSYYRNHSDQGVLSSPEDESLNHDSLTELFLHVCFDQFQMIGGGIFIR